MKNRKSTILLTILMAAVLCCVGLTGALSAGEREQEIVIQVTPGRTVPLEIGENMVQYLSVVYTSANPDIVEVQADGTLYAKAVGTATITAQITRNTVQRTAVFDINVVETLEGEQKTYYLCTACTLIFLEETAADHAMYQCPLCNAMYNKCTPMWHGEGKCVDEPKKPSEPVGTPSNEPIETSKQRVLAHTPHNNSVYCDNGIFFRSAYVRKPCRVKICLLLQ